jgi:hypothetical protein
MRSKSFTGSSAASTDEFDASRDVRPPASYFDLKKWVGR